MEGKRFKIVNLVTTKTIYKERNLKELQRRELNQFVLLIFTRPKIMWVDRHVPTIIFVYGNTF